MPVLLTAVLAGCGASGSATSAATASRSRARSEPVRTVEVAHIRPGQYGYIPSWIPQSTIPVSRIVTASAAHPSLAIQGDTVRVELPRGQVLATVSGPNTPEQGRFPIPRTTSCTFMASFTGARGVVPLDPSGFTTFDEEGHFHSLEVKVVGGGPVPARVAPGHTLTLTMHAVLPTGQGRLIWAPAAGQPIVEWDFDVEID